MSRNSEMSRALLQALSLDPEGARHIKATGHFPNLRPPSRAKAAAAGAAGSAAVVGPASYVAARRRGNRKSRVKKDGGMILVDPFGGQDIEVEVNKVDILPSKARRVSPAYPSAPNMGTGQRLRRFKARGQSQSRVFLYGSKGGKDPQGHGRAIGGSKHKVGKTDGFGARSRREISKSDGRVSNMGGGAEVGRRGTPLSELGKHNRVGHKLPA